VGAKESQALEGRKDAKVSRVSKAAQAEVALWALKEKEVIKGRKATMGTLALRGPRALRALLVHQGHRVTPVYKVCRGYKVI